jgi:hypothetical protein
LKSYCVPYLYFDAEIVDVDVPGAELDPEGWLVIGFEPSLGKAKQKAGLSHAWNRNFLTGVSDDDELKHKVVVVCHL